MQTRRLLFSVSVVVATIPAFPVAADIPPPDAYVETCTLAKQQPTGGDCLECKDDSYQKDRCSILLGSYCYTQRCRTYGTSAWTTILCRSSLGNTPTVPADVLEEITLYPSQLRLTGGSKVGYGPCGTPGILDAGVRPEVSLPTWPEAGIQPVVVDASPSVDVAIAISQPDVGPTAVVDAVVADAPLPWTAADVPQVSTGPEVGPNLGLDTRAPDPTASATQTSTSPQTPSSQPKHDSSGCHVAAGTAAVRTFGPLTLILAALTLVFRRRRSRRE
jgi:hypothetical protein